jgi:hypothetical protein
MKFFPNDPPRVFKIGHGTLIELKDCGRLNLLPDEQVTFITENGAEYDVVRKAWGFYATPSLNGRLRQFGWRSALVRSSNGRYYIMLIESGKEADFQAYLKNEKQTIVTWLDSDETLTTLERKMKSEHDR